ncbi:MAG: class I SAM-dependent methyltransferase [Saprospiraceae bacterium]|nr:class I SAM-dependent methyltransferase [Saprospiraceae bacterium]
MNRGVLSLFLRKLGLIKVADRARFILHSGYYRRVNEEFRKANPAIALPPDYLMYESYRLDYEKYYHGGLQTAKWLISLLRPHLELGGVRILDWGCGPARVIRHLPSILGSENQYYGTDANLESVRWCNETFPEIQFVQNEMEGELNFPQDHFNLIYGISVLTHLSDDLHEKWIQELQRVLKPDGVLLVTTQGLNFRGKLSIAEKKLFDRGHLVIRGRTTLGHRTFSAFHPVPFMKALFSSYQILEHQVPTLVEGKALPQDIWILKKP